MDFERIMERMISPTPNKSNKTFNNQKSKIKRELTEFQKYIDNKNPNSLAVLLMKEVLFLSEKLESYEEVIAINPILDKEGNEVNVDKIKEMYEKSRVVTVDDKGRSRRHNNTINNNYNQERIRIQNILCAKYKTFNKIPKQIVEFMSYGLEFNEKRFNVVLQQYEEEKLYDEEQALIEKENESKTIYNIVFECYRDYKGNRDPHTWFLPFSELPQDFDIKDYEISHIDKDLKKLWEIKTLKNTYHKGEYDQFHNYSLGGGMWDI